MLLCLSQLPDHTCAGSTTVRSACRWWCWAVRACMTSQMPCSACFPLCRPAVGLDPSSHQRAALLRCGVQLP